MDLIVVQLNVPRRLVTDEAMFGPFYFGAAQPSPEAVLTQLCGSPEAVAAAGLPGAEQRAFREVYSIVRDQVTQQWQAQLRFWNEVEYQEQITLEIPATELPDDYTDADVQAWAEEHGYL